MNPSRNANCIPNRHVFFPSFDRLGFPTVWDDLLVIGNNAGLSEGMLGTIHRVTTYNNLLDSDTILLNDTGETVATFGKDPLK